MRRFYADINCSLQDCWYISIGIERTFMSAYFWRAALGTAETYSCTYQSSYAGIARVSNSERFNIVMPRFNCRCIEMCHKIVSVAYVFVVLQYPFVKVLR